MRKKSDRRNKDEGGRVIDSSPRFERLLNASGVEHYSLRLYITGASGHSHRAVTAIRGLCEEFLRGKYDLEVVDIYQQPLKATSAQIIASPTLVKTLPKPLKRFIGNLSDRKKVMSGLDLARAKGQVKRKYEKQGEP
ncbi:MAG: circadian clock KaiB family protein [Limisphaerales bacterium]